MFSYLLIITIITTNCPNYDYCNDDYYNCPHIFLSKMSLVSVFEVKLLPTSWHYSGFGTKLSPIFGIAKSSKYKPIFPLSPMPKSVVVAVGGSVFLFSTTFCSSILLFVFLLSKVRLNLKLKILYLSD